MRIQTMPLATWLGVSSVAMVSSALCSPPGCAAISARRTCSPLTWRGIGMVMSVASQQPGQLLIHGGVAGVDDGAAPALGGVNAIEIVVQGGLLVLAERVLVQLG